MPSFFEIGPAVLEKKSLEGFLPNMDIAAINMDIAAILVMRSGLFINTLVPLHIDVALIGQGFSEKNIFEKCGQ